MWKTCLSNIVSLYARFACKEPQTPPVSRPLTLAQAGLLIGKPPEPKQSPRRASNPQPGLSRKVGRRSLGHCHAGGSGHHRNLVGGSCDLVQTRRGGLGQGLLGLLLLLVLACTHLCRKDAQEAGEDREEVLGGGGGTGGLSKLQHGDEGPAHRLRAIGTQQDQSLERRLNPAG